MTYDEASGSYKLQLTGAQITRTINKAYYEATDGTGEPDRMRRARVSLLTALDELVGADASFGPSADA